MILVHAGFMIAGFLSAASGAAIAKYFRKKKWWFTAHRGAGISGSLFVTTGFAVAVYMVSHSGGEHFSIPHTVHGLIVLLFALATPMLGFLQFRLTAHARQIRTVHRWAGRITIILMFVNIVSGLVISGLM